MLFFFLVVEKSFSKLKFVVFIAYLGKTDVKHNNVMVIS